MPILVRHGYHVYAPDLIGYGRSDQPADYTYSILEEAGFIESFLNANHPGLGEKLGLRKFGGTNSKSLASLTAIRI